YQLVRRIPGPFGICSLKRLGVQLIRRGAQVYYADSAVGLVMTAAPSFIPPIGLCPLVCRKFQPALFSCSSSHSSTVDFFQTLRLPSLKLAGPSPMFAQ